MMNRMLMFFLDIVALATVVLPSVQAQSPLVQAQVDRLEKGRAAPTAGPHGGALHQAAGIRLETVVTQGGIQLFLLDDANQSVSVTQGRGAVSLRVAGAAKRYRYDLLPDGKGGLIAPVNLSKLAGRQVELDIQLVGLPGAGRRVAFQEIANVPPSQQQLAAAAIARQKVCPVSGKPLGSMGQPVAVDVRGSQVFVCCAGCSDALKADPARYGVGRPKITVGTATGADRELIQRQAKCPVMDAPLGSMGKPVKVMVGDKPIFLCCKGCVQKIKATPEKYLAMVYPARESGGGEAAEKND